MKEMMKKVKKPLKDVCLYGAEIGLYLGKTPAQRITTDNNRME
jgi:hypothetical protein